MNWNDLGMHCVETKSKWSNSTVCLCAELGIVCREQRNFVSLLDGNTGCMRFDWVPFLVCQFLKSLTSSRGF